MASIGDSYATQVSTLAKEFSLCCAASALFYWDDKHKQGLRLEADSIMREFVDGVQFGRDPEGILFYHALSDLSSSAGSVAYSVFYNSESTRAIRIDFFPQKADGTTSKTRFVSFLTKDANHVETGLLRNGTGKWGERQMGTCSAKLYKLSSETEVTLTLKAIDKEVIFGVDKSDLIDQNVKVNELPIDINGVFHFRSIDDLKDTSDPTIANYNSDRLLFYPKGKADQLLGVFFPHSPLPIDDSHLRSTSSTANWKNL